MKATADTLPARERSELAIMSMAACRNCGAATDGRFCAACGQSTALHPPTVREFVHEFITHNVALEGALWHTLVALLVRPGQLTLEYFAGRRKRYIPPLRLYLTFSLILFAFGMSGGELRIGNEVVQFKMPEEARNDAFVIGPRSPIKSTGIAFVDRAIARIDALTPSERGARINAGVHQFLPYVLIVLVPVLALYLKLLYWNRRRLYGEHLVVALHAQTVAFLFALVSALALGDLFGAAVLVLFVSQGAIALRRVYGGRLLPTLLRETLLMLVYAMTVGLAVAALATIALVLSV